MDKRQIKFSHLVIIYNNLLTCKILSRPMKREYNVIYNSDDSLFLSEFYFKIWIDRKTIIIFLRVCMCACICIRVCESRNFFSLYCLFVFVFYIYLYIIILIMIIQKMNYYLLTKYYAVSGDAKSQKSVNSESTSFNTP